MNCYEHTFITKQGLTDSQIEKLVGKYEDIVKTNSGEVLKTEKDEEFREMVKMEIEELGPKTEELQEELKQALIPKDPNDEKNAILEIRAGAGGDESALFAGDLFRMYQRFAEKQGWADKKVVSKVSKRDQELASRFLQLFTECI